MEEQQEQIKKQNNVVIQQNTEMREKLKMAEQDSRQTDTKTEYQEVLEKIPGEFDKKNQTSALPKVHMWLSTYIHY